MQLLCDPSAYVTSDALVVPIQCQPLMLTCAKPISEASVAQDTRAAVSAKFTSSDFFPLLRQGE